MIVLGETITWLHVVGSLLIVAGMLVAVRARNKELELERLIAQEKQIANTKNGGDDDDGVELSVADETRIVHVIEDGTDPASDAPATTTPSRSSRRQQPAKRVPVDSGPGIPVPKSPGELEIEPVPSSTANRFLTVSSEGLSPPHPTSAGGLPNRQRFAEE
jgi:hypothetical protein